MDDDPIFNAPERRFRREDADFDFDLINQNLNRENERVRRRRLMFDDNIEEDIRQRNRRLRMLIDDIPNMLPPLDILEDDAEPFMFVPPH